MSHTIFIRYNQLNDKQESLHGAIDHRVDQLRAGSSSGRVLKRTEVIGWPLRTAAMSLLMAGMLG